MTDISVMTDGERVADSLPVSGVRATASRAPRNWAWLGLVPFLLFLTAFLLVPTVSVFSQALRDESGDLGLSSMVDAFSGQNRDAFLFSVRFSAWAALVGVVFGTLLASAASSITRPRWVRGLVVSFSGVAANLGGIPLAFAFLALLGRQGVLTKVFTAAGLDLYAGGFGLDTQVGLIVVYSYFNIPLMVLITLPAIEGMKASWGEANANLGGTRLTYWRRVGLPVLSPSLLGGFLLLFANSFSAYATAAAITDSSRIVSLRLAFFLGGDVNAGADAVGYSLAAWMILIMGVAMGLYWVLRRWAERWQS